MMKAKPSMQELRFSVCRACSLSSATRGLAATALVSGQLWAGQGACGRDTAGRHLHARTSPRPAPIIPEARARAPSPSLHRTLPKHQSLAQWWPGNRATEGLHTPASAAHTCLLILFGQLPSPLPYSACTRRHQHLTRSNLPSHLPPFSLTLSQLGPTHPLLPSSR